MGWFESFAGGFVILIILSLIFIVIGFLGDATGREHEEPAIETKRSLYLDGMGWLLIAGVWAAYAISELRVDTPSWWTFAALGVISLLAAFRAFMRMRRAVRLD